MTRLGARWQIAYGFVMLPAAIPIQARCPNMRWLIGLLTVMGALWSHGCHVGGHDDDLHHRLPRPMMRR